jgi:hypothetical protein
MICNCVPIYLNHHSGAITRRISNGTTLSDVFPPEQLQTLADNVTDALLPTTPEDFDLSKFMGRWFEGNQ